MNEEHEGWFRQHLRIAIDPLPNQLLKLYWEYKQLADASSVYLDTRDLINITVMARAVPERIADPQLAVDARAGKLQFGDIIEVKWRGEWRKAQFRGHNGRNVLTVCLEGDPEERGIVAHDARYAAARKGQPVAK